MQSHIKRGDKTCAWSIDYRQISSNGKSQQLRSLWRWGGHYSQKLLGQIRTCKHRYSCIFVLDKITIQQLVALRHHLLFVPECLAMVACDRKVIGSNNGDITVGPLSKPLNTNCFRDCICQMDKMYINDIYLVFKPPLQDTRTTEKETCPSTGKLWKHIREVIQCIYK